MAGKSTKSSTTSSPGKSRQKRATVTAKKTGPRILHLKGQLNIHEVGSLKTRLGRFLDANQGVILDASKVEKIDTAVMQLLTAFCRSAGAKGIAVKWKNPNSRILHSAEILGLAKPLGLEDTAHHKTG